jgi:tetratricopeptide (TPR) repeat protein
VRTGAFTSFVLMVALAAAAAAVRAGDDTETKHLAEASQALESGKWDEAKRLYEAALSESPDSILARAGLAKALEGKGDKTDAIVALRQVVREAAQRGDLSAQEEKAREESEQRLAKVDPNGSDLQGILQGYAGKVISLALRYKHKDPDLAQRALSTALGLDPANERGLKLQEQLLEERRQPLFDGKQIKTWLHGDSPYWRVENGVIVGDAHDVASYIRTQETTDGDFDVSMDARVVKTFAGQSFFALQGAFKAEDEFSALGVMDEDLVWFEGHASKAKVQVYQRPLAALPGAVDPTAWNTYELRFRGDEVVAMVDGKEAYRIPRDPARDGGYLALLCQHCTVQFRNVFVTPR